MDKPYFLPDKYAMKKKIDRLEQQLAKANERAKKLEKINLELAANVEACCELTEMDMGAAIDRLFEIDNTESKALLNKFAIEKQLETAKKCAFGSTSWVLEHIKFLEEQLRKGQKQC
jgi:hypothetical protein